jgi:hypothetical protein
MMHASTHNDSARRPGMKLDRISKAKPLHQGW